MKNLISFFCVIILFCTGCASLFSTEEPEKGKENTQTQSNSSKKGFLSYLFGDDSENDNQNHNSNGPGGLEFRSNNGQRLQSSFQQPMRNRGQNRMLGLSPLHLTRIEGNTWRTAANPAIVYGIITRLLSQSYIISGVDRKNLNVQTDWDKFFINGRLFRNRMSVTVFPVGSRQTEVVIKNSVEYYTGTLAKQEENTAWLPSPDLTDEVTKLVENTDKQTAFAYSQNMRN